MKKSLLALIAGTGLIVAGTLLHYHQPPHPTVSRVLPAQTQENHDSSVDQAFRQHLSNVQVHGQGLVVKILKDDTRGLRHQKFILRLDSGRTLLIVHNIGQAPRLNDLQPGDTVEFSGEYEWNPEGGLVHWTHHTAHGRHPSGWLRHNGKLFR